MRVHGKRFQFHQHDIDSNLYNAFKRNEHVAALAEEMKCPIARHHKAQNLCTPPRENDVADAPQDLAIDDVNNLLTAQFTKR